MRIKSKVLFIIIFIVFSISTVFAAGVINLEKLFPVVIRNGQELKVFIDEFNARFASSTQENFENIEQTLNKILARNPVANQHLLPPSNGTTDIGSAALNWRKAHLKDISAEAITVNGIITIESYLAVKDGIASPEAAAGWTRIFVDVADGDLKVKFGDGITKTLATD